MTRTAVMATFLVAAVAGPSIAHADNGHSGTAEVLVKSTQSWNGKPYTPYAAGQPELTVLKLTVAAHSALPWHTHPFPNAGYVLSGALTIEDKASGKTQTFHAGQAFTESVDDAHRGRAGDEEAVVILTYAGIKGQPTTIPLPGQAKEY